MIELGPLARLALLGAVIALAPLAWVWLRHRGAESTHRLRALTWLTLFLTFDLVLFGAFTRLTDSGLGCPDWPGCYGHASPLGAAEQIGTAQTALPSGPVTHGKAWVEMVHRYLASAVGVLIAVIALRSWLERRGQRWDQASQHPRGDAPSPWWATVTLLWVCVQGAFGALTVTLKLYPAIVTAHLLGGLVLLVLLAAQGQAFVPRPLSLSPGTVRGAWLLAALVSVQVALGGWVSTNYAVLACQDFPTCQDSWWPAMDFSSGFTLQRELGATAQGGFLPFEALTAIHVVHRWMAAVVLVAMLWMASRLARDGRAKGSAEFAAHGGDAASHFGRALVLLAAWQLASGLSNVVLGWPLIAALAHSGGAAALAILLTLLIVRSRQAGAVSRSSAAVGAEPLRWRAAP